MFFRSTRQFTCRNSTITIVWHFGALSKLRGFEKTRSLLTENNRMRRQDTQETGVGHDWIPIRETKRRWRPPICSRTRYITYRGGQSRGCAGTVVYGVCIVERCNPAVAKCGHVFCWKCHLHWTRNVTEECPLCRSMSRLQDVIGLYNPIRY